MFRESQVDQVAGTREGKGRVVMDEIREIHRVQITKLGMRRFGFSCLICLKLDSLLSTDFCDSVL